MALVCCFLSTSKVGADELGTDWVPRWPTPTNNSVVDLAVNGSSNLVAVGNHGTILSTNDLSTWTKVETGITDDVVGVVWTGAQYYAVTLQGKILVSNNSTTWTVKYTSSTDQLSCVGWNGSRVVAAGAYVNGSTYGAVVVTSSDGTNWTRRTFPNMNPITRMAWSGTMLVGIMNGAAISTLDGSSWAIHPLSVSSSTGAANTKSIVWTGGSSSPQFLISGDTVWHSYDGVVWSEYKTLGGAAGAFLSWTGSELVVSAGSESSGNVVLSSTDQQTFTNRSTGLPSNETYAVRYNGALVMVGQGGHVDYQLSLGTWTPSYVSSSSLSIRDVAFNQSAASPLYVGVGSQMTWTSTDGNAWVEHAQSGKAFGSITWTGTQFVAAGLGIWTSPDGVTWTNSVPVDANNTQSWATVAWINGKGYASGFDSGTNTVLSKTSDAATGGSGTTWTDSTMPAQVQSIAVNDDHSRLLAVGYSGIFLNSTDNGATWTAAALTAKPNFSEVAFGNGKFVAVALDGSIWSTTNGTTWGFVTSAPVSLNSLVRAGNQFIAVGNRGEVATSFDGSWWQIAESGTTEQLLRVIYANNRLTATGASANIITSDGTPPAPPSIEFATTSSTMMEGGSVGVVLTLSRALRLPVQVTLGYSGTAVAADYGGPGTTVTLAAGDTSKFLVFTATDNNAIQGAKTLIVTMSAPSGGALLGTNVTHTITINENDSAPAFDLSPADQLAVVGSAVTLTSHASGTSSLKYQWKKNGVAITGATSPNYTIAKVAAANAGKYSVVVTSPVGNATSLEGRLGVITSQNLVQVVKQGGTATFSATAAGPDLSYQWRNSNQALSNGGRFSGATTSKLVITSVTAADSGVYTCDVTLGTGMNAPALAATVVDYTALGVVPVVSPIADIHTRVSSPVDFTPAASGKPYKWSATGLPAGVVINAVTGRLTGRCTKNGTYAIKFIASNLIGPSASATLNLTVDSLTTATLGNFIALMDRDTTVNAGLGGRVDLTVAATGSFTGRLTMPAAVLPFSGVLAGARGSSPTATVAVPHSAFVLTFSIDEDFGLVDASVSNGSKTILGSGFGQAVASTTKRTGPYNIALQADLASTPGFPEGYGIGQFTLAATGASTAAGKLADGTAYTVATFTGTDGSIPVYQALYAGKGSVTGLIKVNENSASNYVNNSVTGTLTWFKSAVAGSRSYAAGIPLMNLFTDGGRYIPPVAGAIVMNLTAANTNAILGFNGGGLAGASRNPAGLFTITAPAKVAPPASNVASTTLVFASVGGVLNGLFSGQFTLVDNDDKVSHKMLTRIVPYSGIAIRPSGSPSMVGRGFFNLPQMPTASPLTSLTTSPIKSGIVTIER